MKPTTTPLQGLRALSSNNILLVVPYCDSSDRFSRRRVVARDHETA